MEHACNWSWIISPWGIVGRLVAPIGHQRFQILYCPKDNMPEFVHEDFGKRY
jgi:hypothetical protein